MSNTQPEAIGAPTRSLSLYLIRHGQTKWSISHQHTGRTDIPLTGEGEREARSVGERLRAISFSHILSSPMQRAQRTFALTGLPNTAEIEPDLSEWDYGDYEGERTEDIRKGRPNWKIFRDGCPNGEMPTQVSARADRLIARLRTLEGKVALFSHGQFSCVLGARWIELPVMDGPHFLLGTASLSILGYDPDHPEVPVIALWNASPSEKSESVTA
jgi:broad specificity phosphatase PhoE